VTVLDAFAVVALLRGEPAASEVQALLEGGDDTVLTSLGLAEVVDHLVRVVGTSEDDAVLDVAQLGLMDAITVDADLALNSALLRARHYHRIDRAVSLADCVAAEAARARSAGLATADPHLLDLCRDERIAAIPLPDSGGITWSS
jgi:PIN domain nuclease of toxin-antitoxin system